MPACDVCFNSCASSLARHHSRLITPRDRAAAPEQVTDAQKDLVDPPVNGTRNVLTEASNSDSVTRVVGDFRRSVGIPQGAVAERILLCS